MRGTSGSMHDKVACRMIDCETHEEFKRFDSMDELAKFLGKPSAAYIIAQVLRKGNNTRGRTKYNGKWYALRPISNAQN